jgi:hypothetical protein
MSYKIEKFVYKGQTLEMCYKDKEGEGENIASSNFKEVRELVEKLKKLHNLTDDDFTFGSENSYGDNYPSILYYAPITPVQLEQRREAAKQQAIKFFEHELSKSRETLRKFGELS